MSVPIVRAEVTEYVAAVRAQLDDLSPDEVDELTGGLEADLDDALDDGPAAGRDPAERFGPPEAYAAELRAAAGLPPRAVSGGRREAGALRRAREDLASRVTSHPRWPAVRDFLLAIRPAWWVARAVAAVAVLRALLGLSGLSRLLVFVLAVVISVEWGRRRLAHRNNLWRAGIAAGNALAVLVVLFGGVGLGLPMPAREVVVTQNGPENGVWVDGTEVRNIFPFDEQGRPLSGVQLYDENGRPVAVGDSARTPVGGRQGDVAQVPAVDTAGEQHWNVYPLRQQTQTWDDNGQARPDPSGPSAATAPTVTPRPLLVGGSSPAPSAGSPTASSPTAGSPTAGSPTASSPTVTTTPSGAVAPTPSAAPPTVTPTPTR